MPALPRPKKWIALGAALALLAAGCGGPPTPHPTTQRAPLISVFEAPLQLATAPGPTLDLLRRLGVQYVRLVVRWSSVAPSSASAVAPAGFSGTAPGAYPAAGWTVYDTIVRDARARHMGVIVDISGPAPQWASGPGAPRGGVPGVWKPSAAKFGAFAHAVGIRYSGHYTPPGEPSPLPRISFWSIWNEPNLGQANLAPQAIDNSAVESSPMLYRALVDNAWAALQQSGHGADTTLIAELAPYGQSVGNNVPGNFGYMVPLRFVRALYCVDASLRPLRGSAAALRGCPTTAAGSARFAAAHPALFRATGFAVHPYPQGSVPPNVVLAGEPDFANLAALPKLEQVLGSVTNTYGVGRQFPLYSTEYGYFTNPPYSLGAPLELAAADLNWAEYISWRDPRIRSWDQYLLVDPKPGGPSNFVTGLEFYGGKPKPTYAAFRMPLYLPITRQTHGHGVEVWGCVRPAPYAALDTGRAQTARIELQSAGAGPFKSVATVPITDSSCYFDTTVRFPSGGTVRLAWSYPGGRSIYSRLVTITAG